MQFRDTHIKVWWAYTCVSPKFSASFDSILVITSQANKLKLACRHLIVPPAMKLHRRLVSKTSYAYDL